MQPTCRQVPPRNGSFSTTIVFRPSSPARIAATYPPGPLPMIATSYLATRILPSVGVERRGQGALTVSRSNHLEGIRPLRSGAERPCPRRRVPQRRKKAHKKPSALPAQTAAFQQTSKFNSHLPPSQPASEFNLLSWYRS